MNRPPRQTMRQIFGWPMLIGVLSTVGLVSALVGDGIWDGLSWAALLVPILLYGGFLAVGRQRRT